MQTRASRARATFSGGECAKQKKYVGETYNFRVDLILNIFFSSSLFMLRHFSGHYSTTLLIIAIFISLSFDEELFALWLVWNSSSSMLVAAFDFIFRIQYSHGILDVAVGRSEWIMLMTWMMLALDKSSWIFRAVWNFLSNGSK